MKANIEKKLTPNVFSLSLGIFSILGPPSTLSKHVFRTENSLFAY